MCSSPHNDHLAQFSFVAKLHGLDRTPINKNTTIVEELHFERKAHAAIINVIRSELTWG